MNTAKATNVIDPIEDIETTGIARLEALPKPAQVVIRGTQSRYGLLLGVALLAAALAFAMLNLNKGINAEFDKIQANMALPVYHH